MKPPLHPAQHSDPVGPWTAPPAPWPDGSLRQSIRQSRRAEGRLLVALDDDPTGSQAVHGVQVVTVDDQDEFRRALDTEAGSCFVLTNSRSLGEADAVELTKTVAGELFALAAERGVPLDIVSRSDSTLRGHVVAEVTALNEARQTALGHGYDAVLFAPSYLESGRVTADDIHWAKVGDEFVAVGSTEFARDATFGFHCSNLREFVVEVGRGAVLPDKIRTISLRDIRLGGPNRVAEMLADVTNLDFVVINALSYSDLEVIALGALRAGRNGKSLLYRSGPSLVRALDGQDPIEPLTAQQIWKDVPELAEAADVQHGLVVVGSHVGQTSRQIQALQAATPMTEIAVDVPTLLGLPDAARASYVAALAARVSEALPASDVLVYTSRSLVTGFDGDESLRIARIVSGAVSDVVRLSLDARPAWIIAKGGVTSHDVAIHGLGIRRAEVVGQLFPGIISVFRAIDADPRATGRPYVVFAGNVGDVNSLTQVVAKLRQGRPRQVE